VGFETESEDENGLAVGDGDCDGCGGEESG